MAQVDVVDISVEGQQQCCRMVGSFDELVVSDVLFIVFSR